MERFARTTCVMYLAVLGLVGCGGEPGAESPASPPATSSSTQTSTSEAPVRERKPAKIVEQPAIPPDIKSAESPASDALPELAPPAGAKDDREDAKPR